MIGCVPPSDCPRIRVVARFAAPDAAPLANGCNATCRPRTLPGDAFERFPAHGHDVHYAPTPGARRFSFGRGNLGRLAARDPGSTVPAGIHRAPATPPGVSPWLLSIR